MLRAFAEGVLDVLVPQTCAETGRLSELALSRDAMARRPHFGEPICDTCCGPVDGPLAECLVCSDSSLSAVIAAAPYVGWWRQRIRQMKFQPQPGFAVAFGVLLGDLLVAEELPENTVIAPIPATNIDGVLRGAPTYVLAASAAECSGYPCHELLQRRHPGKAQRLMSRQERGELTADVFDVALPTPPPELVVLVDDVMTTGATLNAAATALKAVSPGLHVVALVLGRAGSPVLQGA